jgi:hypothetical protein
MIMFYVWEGEGMFAIRLSLFALVLIGLNEATYAQSSDPCAPGCAELYKNGCPKGHCAANIENNVCHPYCSGTNAVPPLVQYYFNGKIYTFSPQSVTPQQVEPQLQ